MTEKSDERRNPLRDILPEVGRRLAEDWVRTGYDHASNLALDLLETRIDDLHEKVRSGGKLSQQEVYLLTNISDIRSELEREFQSGWETNFARR